MSIAEIRRPHRRKLMIAEGLRRIRSRVADMPTRRGPLPGSRGKAPRVKSRINRASAKAIFTRSVASHAPHNSSRSLEPSLATFPIRAERGTGGQHEQGDAGQKQKRLQRPGLIADLDLMAPRAERDRAEVGSHADQARALAVDSRHQARKVGDFDQRIAGALHVDARAIDFPGFRLGEDAARWDGLRRRRRAAAAIV